MKKSASRGRSFEQWGYRGGVLRLAPAGESAAPSTFDRAARRVDVTAATEQPIEMWHPIHGRVPEILLARGAQLPERVPLLDSHPYLRGGGMTMLDQLGSATPRREPDAIAATLMFSTVERGEGALTLVEEGHLGTVSVGYRRLASVFVPEKERRKVAGRDYSGPVLVTTSWALEELSLTPIPRDPAATARGLTLRGEEEMMNEKLRKGLEARGLKAEATEEEAWSFLSELEGRGIVRADIESSEGASSASGVSEGAARAAGAESVDGLLGRAFAEGQAEEIARRQTIQALGEEFAAWGGRSLAEELIREKKDVHQARERFLARMAAASRTGADVGVVIVADGREKFAAAASEGLLVRGGLLPPSEARAGGNDLASYSLMELARLALRQASLPTGGSAPEVAARAITSSDLANIAANTAKAAITKGFTGSKTHWRTVAGIGQLPNYLETTIVGAGGVQAFGDMNEDGELPYTTLNDKGEKAQIRRTGRRVRLTPQIVVNDGLGFLTSMPLKFGEAADRTVDAAVFGLLSSPPTMADGVALFHANHGNLATSHSHAPDVDALTEADAAMSAQTSLTDGEVEDVVPSFFVAPRAKMATFEQFFRSNYVGPMLMVDGGAVVPAGAPSVPAALSASPNPFAGDYITRVYTNRLSGTAWFLLAQKGQALMVYFLNGVEAPQVESHILPGGTLEIWAVLDFDAAVADHIGCFKNAGA